MIINNINELTNLNLTDKIVGISSGCFDMYHFHHLHYLERCKAECDFLIIGIDSDLLVRQNKNKTPNIPEYNRARIIESLKCVDCVFVMRNLAQLEKVITYGHKLFKNQPTIYDTPVIGQGKIEIVIIPDVVETTSTSELVDKIKNS